MSQLACALLCTAAALSAVSARADEGAADSPAASDTILVDSVQLASGEIVLGSIVSVEPGNGVVILPRRSDEQRKIPWSEICRVYRASGDQPVQPPASTCARARETAREGLFGVTLMAGAGTAYDLLGLHVEARVSQLALFVGSGVPVLVLRDPNPGTAHYDLVLGMRYFSGKADRFFLSFQSMISLAGDQATLDTGAPSGGRNHLKSFGSTAGWRWRFGRHALLELGAGLTLIQFDPGCEGCQVPRLLPDVSIAGGYDF